MSDTQKDQIRLSKYANSLPPGEERQKAFNDVWKKDKEMLTPTIFVAQLPEGLKEIAIKDYSKIKKITTVAANDDSQIESIGKTIRF